MQKLAAAMFLSFVAIPQIAAAEEIRWFTNLDAAIQAAVQQRKPLMMHCWFEGCGPCKMLDTYVFPNAELAKTINQSVIPVKVDITIQREIAKRYGVERVPQDVFITPSGYVLLKRPSPREPKEYMKVVQAVYQLYQTQDALVSSSLNHTDTKQELAQFGGQIQQQARQAGSDQKNSFVSRGTTVVDQANGKINDQVVGNMNQVANYLDGDSGDKYNTDQRFMPPSQQPYTTQATHNQVPGAQIAASASPSSGSKINGLVANPFVNQPAPASQAVLGNRRPTAERETREQTQIPSDQPVAQSPQGSFAEPQVQKVSEKIAAENVEVPNPEIRPAEPGPALDGYCPVSLKHSRQWVKGDLRWGCYHRGILFLFSSKENRDLFLTQPDQFSPALVGYDPVVYAETGELVTGSRKVGVFYPAEKPVIYVFANEESKVKFQQNPELFANKVRVATAECDQSRTLR